MECNQENAGKEGKGKFKTSISLNNYLKERLDEEIKRGTFVSNSDAVGTSLSKMFGHLDERRKLQESERIYDALKTFEEILQTEEGKKAVEKLLNKEMKKSDELESQDDSQKQEPHNKKSQALFGGDPKDYSPTNILE